MSKAPWFLVKIVAIACNLTLDTCILHDLHVPSSFQHQTCDFCIGSSYSSSAWASEQSHQVKGSARCLNLWKVKLSRFKTSFSVSDFFRNASQQQVKSLIHWYNIGYRCIQELRIFSNMCWIVDAFVHWWLVYTSFVPSCKQPPWKFFFLHSEAGSTWQLVAFKPFKSI